MTRFVLFFQSIVNCDFDTASSSWTFDPAFSGFLRMLLFRERLHGAENAPFFISNFAPYEVDFSESALITRPFLSSCRRSVRPRLNGAENDPFFSSNFGPVWSKSDKIGAEKGSVLSSCQRGLKVLKLILILLDIAFSLLLLRHCFVIPWRKKASFSFNPELQSPLQNSNLQLDAFLAEAILAERASRTRYDIFG